MTSPCLSPGFGFASGLGMACAAALPLTALLSAQSAPPRRRPGSSRRRHRRVPRQPDRQRPRSRRALLPRSARPGPGAGASGRAAALGRGSRPPAPPRPAAGAPALHRRPHARHPLRRRAGGDQQRRSTPVRRRMQDPGAVTLILLVRDIDAAFAKLKAAGVPVVTTGGAPLAMSTANKTRAVIVQDPDGHFVELAQLDPLPATTAPASSNVIGIRLRVTVADMDGTLRFYQRAPRPDRRAAAVLVEPAGVGDDGPAGRASTGWRTIRMPGSPLLLELLELKGLGPATVRSRVQDPGSFRLQLNVRDIDAALAGMTAAGSTVVSSNRAPVSMTFGIPAVAPGGRARSQQPVPGRAAAAAGSAAAGAAAQAARGATPAGRRCAVRAPGASSASTASRATTPARARRTWRSTRWTSPTSRTTRAVWEKVIKKVRAGAMPPQGMPQPDGAGAARRWCRSSRRRIDRAAAATPNPGRPALHRLNRVEYQNVDPRSAGARRRRRVAAAGRRFELRLRQHRRRAGRVAGAARALHRRRPRSISALAVGDPASAADRQDLPRPVRPDADRPHRRAAARHARRHADPRHVPARRRVRDQAEAVAHQRRLHPRAGVLRTRSRSASTASACTW